VPIRQAISAVWFVLLAGCVTQLKATDIVRDPAAAISIAKAAFLHDAPAEGSWDATLNDGLWNVQQTFEKSESGCGWGIRAAFWAGSGKTKPCDICVVAT
jgi:hypothetical protein